MERATAKVLILDDESFTLKLHAHILSQLGFHSVRTFENGHLALADFDDTAPPDLILLDLSMPELDGVEFIRHLVWREYAGSLILISAEDERILQSAERLVRAHGIDILGHLKKPVKPAKLKNILDDWENRAGDAPRAPGKSYSAGDVRNAIRNGELIAYFQPKVSVKTGEIVGVEALARWQHPSDGLILPGRFIGVAEENGLIEDLTRAMFRQGIKEIRALEASGMSLQIAINLAPSTLGSVEVADFLSSEAANASVAPHNVVLEVTESQLIGDRRASLDVLTRLRLMRFKLSIDDFGTGYSSMTQLREMPFDELKIDQSFVHRAGQDETARAMYEASLGLARQLKLKTVAEGVEDRADWDFVRGTECDTAQGFFIARPMPSSALQTWAASWRHRMVTELV